MAPILSYFDYYLPIFDPPNHPIHVLLQLLITCQFSPMVAGALWRALMRDLVCMHFEKKRKNEV